MYLTKNTRDHDAESASLIVSETRYLWQSMQDINYDGMDVQSSLALVWRRLELKAFIQIGRVHEKTHRLLKGTTDEKSTMPYKLLKLLSVS